MDLIIQNIEYKGPCIYAMWSGKDTDKLYFGRTTRYAKRVQEHKWALKAGRHHNTYLQRVFNLSSEFNIVPFELCLPDKLDEREMFWISFYNTNHRDYGYNLTEGGQDLKIHSQESIKKRAITRTGKSTSLKGRRQSVEWIENRANANRGQVRNYSPEHISAIKKTMAKNKGTRHAGKEISITEISTGIITTFNSRRDIEDFLLIPRDKLLYMYYKGKKRTRLQVIEYKGYIIPK